jgi:hypothetical protein
MRKFASSIAHVILNEVKDLGLQWETRSFARASLILTRLPETRCALTESCT